MLRSIQVLWAALAAMAMLAGGQAWAAPEDFRLEAAGQPVKAGETTLIRLRLVHVPDGKPVAGAILIQPKLEMGEGHGAMTAPVKVAAPPSEPGMYTVEARPGMGGEWVLSISAKVPGEAGTVRGRLALNLAQ
jgi:hypothetical protein